jgi:glycosyltransferase involved in cell wall biosynthesis
VLAALADRLVVTHQDLIGFHNVAYFPSTEGWRGYRDLTRRALGAADHVVFASDHVRSDALREELVDPHRASVIHFGVDHRVLRRYDEPIPPAAAGTLPPDAEVILCLGTDLLHKNRVFALSVVAEMQRRHAWLGKLVLAGPEVAYGSSRDAERTLRAGDPGLDAAVLELGEVSEAEKEWLLRRAGLVLYPTVQEGFGLIPYEAAAHGVPCMWAASTALRELLPESAATIVAWDAAATADRALALIRDRRARADNIHAVQVSAMGLRWDDTAKQLIRLYRAVCDEPSAPTAALERYEGVMQRGLSEDAMRLVGPDGLLPKDLERPLLALLGRPKLAAPLLGGMKAGYRASQLRRRAR